MKSSAIISCELLINKTLIDSVTVWFSAKNIPSAPLPMLSVIVKESPSVPLSPEPVPIPPGIASTIELNST